MTCIQTGAQATWDGQWPVLLAPQLYPGRAPTRDDLRQAEAACPPLRAPAPAPRPLSSQGAEVTITFSWPLRTPSLQRTRMEDLGEAEGADSHSQRAGPSSGSVRMPHPGSAKGLV